MDKITQEEYEAAIKWAEYTKANSARSRIILALDGAWRDAHEFLPAAVSHIVSPSGKNAADLIDNHLRIIAEGRALPLPVDHPGGVTDMIKPCPECGGAKWVEGNDDDPMDGVGSFSMYRKPCHACRGTGRG